MLAVFVSILLPIDLAEQIRRVDGLENPLAAAFQLSLLNLPGHALRDAAAFHHDRDAVFCSWRLARTSRTGGGAILGAVGAAGQTMSPVAMAILIGVIGVSAINPIVAATDAGL